MLNKPERFMKGDDHVYTKKVGNDMKLEINFDGSRNAPCRDRTGDLWITQIYHYV